MDSEGGDFDPQIYNCNDYEALLQKVVKKDFNAMRMLAIMYERGFVVQQDTDKAIEILEEAANLGDVTTQSYLGSGETDILIKSIEKSDGTFDVDDSRMLYWRNKAANNGDSYSQHQLAVSIQDKSPNEAIKWYEQSAKNGFTQSMTELADIYYKGNIAPKSLEKAIYWNEQAVLAGDLYTAPRQLYIIYDDNKQYILATAWLEKFCSNADLHQHNACTMLNNEIKPSIKAKEAFELGMVYFEDGVLQNYELSEKWFTASCQNNNDVSCEYSDSAATRKNNKFEHGLTPDEYWEKGFDIKRERQLGEKDLSYEYYFEAARKGNVKAQVFLGNAYLYRGAPNDYKKAKKWFETSLKSNDKTIIREAYLGLGTIYYDGLGVRRNVYQGRDFIGKSCDMGLEDACATYAKLFIQ